MAAKFNATSVVPTGDVALDLVAAADAQRDKPTTKAGPPRRRRRPKLDPWERVPFNSKVPRWMRSMARAFADEQGLDLQDLHAMAMLHYALAQGFDVERFLPEAGPKAANMSQSAELLGRVLEQHGMEPPVSEERADQ